MRIARVLLAGLAASLLAAPLAAQDDEIAVAAPSPANDNCSVVPDPPRRELRGTVLTMAPHRFTVGDSSYQANVYNGNFLGPTLTVNPGQRVELMVRNNMRGTTHQSDSVVAWTNYHYHGLVVTPSPDSGDNVTHVHTRQGESKVYRFPIPGWHTEGMMWYHPHPHGISTSQVGGGLSGALLLGNVLRYFRHYQGVRERVLLIRDMGFSISRSQLNINGSTCALLPMAPGEEQLWHIGNFGSNTFVNLKLEGMRWTLLAMDGNRLPREMEIDSLYIPPGSRAEVIVTAPDAGKRVRLYSAPFIPRTTRETTLGWVVSQGSPRLRSAPPAVRGEDAAVLDTMRFLREAPEVKRDTFRFQFIGNDAGINDSIYAPNHPPVAIPWGQVQEWTLINETKALHTFHIHQTDFAIISINGQPVDERLLRDNVPLGVHPVIVKDSQGRDSTVFAGDTIVVRFTFEPIAAGPFVFHCHVLQHEDEGMMKNVCVYDPNDPDGPARCRRLFESGAGHGTASQPSGSHGGGGAAGAAGHSPGSP